MGKKADELVVYMVFRKDLKMSAGKIAAQAGHAIQLLLKKHAEHLRDAPDVDEGFRWLGPLREWERGSYAKVALAVEDLAGLGQVISDLALIGAPYVEVIDEGRTEVAHATLTCIAVGPRPKSELATVLGRLPLLR